MNNTPWQHQLVHSNGMECLEVKPNTFWSYIQHPMLCYASSPQPPPPPLSHQPPLPSPLPPVLTAIFQVTFGNMHIVTFLYMFWKRSYGTNDTGYSQPKWPSCYPANSVTALKESQSTDSSHPTGLILSLSTTGFLGVGALIPMYQLFDTSMPLHSAF